MHEELKRAALRRANKPSLRHSSEVGNNLRREEEFKGKVFRRSPWQIDRIVVTSASDFGDNRREKGEQGGRACLA
ncbi:hypothetical protein KM043_004261 [Ampulex compressa]|nr:hypothetical protein KM043_004261 [Ampulex compressa]